jgi:hypothetical protein
MLGIARAVEPVHALQQRSPEDDGSIEVTPGAQQEVNLDIYWPRNERSATERSQQAGSKFVTPPLRAVAGRDEGPGVADDQSTRRESTSSTRSERLGSSSMIPA